MSSIRVRAEVFYQSLCAISKAIKSIYAEPNGRNALFDIDADRMPLAYFSRLSFLSFYAIRNPSQNWVVWNIFYAFITFLWLNLIMYRILRRREFGLPKQKNICVGLNNWFSFHIEVLHNRNFNFLLFGWVQFELAFVVAFVCSDPKCVCVWMRW